ncbi:MAG: sigma-70 family RNA polymerase sigma factor [Myxococcaceae bacterium]|nr:sigma-70 family RNA polymerase sigma factor [Myxococcaceae bacterium]
MHELITDALRGNRTAQARLVRLLTPVIRQRAVDGHADDLVQDVLELLFRNEGHALSAWNPQRGLSLESYVAVLAMRVAAAKRRSGRKGGWREQPTEAGALIDAAGTCPVSARRPYARDVLSKLFDALKRELNPRAQALFVQLFVEGESVTEVSDATGLSPCAVYAWRSRLRRTANEVALSLG